MRCETGGGVIYGHTFWQPGYDQPHWSMSLNPWFGDIFDPFPWLRIARVNNVRVLRFTQEFKSEYFIESILLNFFRFGWNWKFSFFLDQNKRVKFRNISWILSWCSFSMELLSKWSISKIRNDALPWRWVGVRSSY